MIWGHVLLAVVRKTSRCNFFSGRTIMDNQVFYKLVDETRLQCGFARFAFQNLRSSVNSLDPENAFFYVDAFLLHAGNVSRLLWPERSQSQTRGERFRTEL